MTILVNAVNEVTVGRTQEFGHVKTLLSDAFYYTHSHIVCPYFTQIEKAVQYLQALDHKEI